MLQGSVGKVLDSLDFWDPRRSDCLAEWLLFAEPVSMEGSLKV